MSVSPDVLDALKHPSDDEVAVMDAWWRANNYLIVGQIYLQSNPLLHEALTPQDVKPRLLGHWGTSPGLSFLYTHASRLIQRTGQEMLYITGPGHGGPALTAAAYLEGTYTETYPRITTDEEGMRVFFRQFSQPGGIPSHASATTPGSIHEGGELGYSLTHAFGAVMDNPDLISLAVVGDGEAETGPLEGSWKGISFLNPEHDGAVLPILHLNGGKIAAPTVQARKKPEELRKLYEGHGYEVIEVEITPETPHDEAHRIFSAALGDAYGKIRAIQDEARTKGVDERPTWPMIIFRHPKGWTGPHEVDGTVMEGTWRSHQVPLSGVKEDPEHLALLEQWMRTYRPEELFDEKGAPTEIVRRANPTGNQRMSDTPHANGGLVSEPLDIPDLDTYETEVPEPGAVRAESTRVLGRMMRDIYERNPHNFRLFCPDETNSNRLGSVFEVAERSWMEPLTENDEKIGPRGRVMEVLSEHLTHGWLEAYTLTGRHGLFATYEAFGMVSASQTVQHIKWLEEHVRLPWRAPVPSLNILLSSTCWRNDHNGFSHQAPALINVVLDMKDTVTRVFFPVDANSLAVVANHAFSTPNRVHVIVQDKQPQLQFLTMEQAKAHAQKGYGTWDWASNEPADGSDPDIVLASAGDVVTMEVVAAAEILKEKLPELKFRVVNVMNLTTLARPKDSQIGMSELDFTEQFTDDKDVLFAFHGYPGQIHKLVHGRPDADRFHVRGFIEEGTTTTPFDMVVRNEIDRYHLIIDVINNSQRKVKGMADLKRWAESMLTRHAEYSVEHLLDMPEVRDWYRQQPSLDGQGISAN